jgi:signal transduction histidine kinase
LNILIKTFLLVSISLNIYLFYKTIIGKRGIIYITTNLIEIRNSGFSRRINIGFRFKALEKVSTELNVLMDKFQSTLEEKQRLELSHKQLIANISHDIRTPLTSLLGFVEVLQKNENISLKEQKDYLDIIHSKGQSLYNMIQDFFELSKLESEDTIIKLEKINLVDTVKEVIASFYQDFVINKIAPEIQLPQEEVYVWGNEASIERVLHNLISNVLKYGSDGEIIGISIRIEASEVWVDIWDKGKGILEKDLPFLFNRLYTTEVSRNEKLRGNGLGLAIAKQLVEKQNGEIRVSSIPGEKTIFSFYLIRF